MTRTLHVNPAALDAWIRSAFPWAPNSLVAHAVQALTDQTCRDWGVEALGPPEILLTCLEEAHDDADLVRTAQVVLEPGPALFQLRRTTPREVDGIPVAQHHVYRWATAYVPDRDARLYARNGLIPNISLANRLTIQEALQRSSPQPRVIEGTTKPVTVTTSPQAAYQLVDQHNLAEFQADLAQAKTLAFDTETTRTPGWEHNPQKKAVRRRWDTVVGISASTHPGSGWYLDTRPGTAPPEALMAALQDPALPKVGHNLPFDLQAIQHTFGIEVQGTLTDTQVVAWLLGHESGHLGLKERALSDLGIRMIEYDELAQGRDMAIIPPAEIAQYAGADADIPLRLLDLYLPQIEAQGLQRPMEIEQRMVKILHALSWKGVYLDTSPLPEMTERVRAEAQALKDQHFPGINLRSHKQLSDYLYKTLGYVLSDPTKRKADGTFAKDKGTIKELLFQYNGDPLLMALLRISELDKLDSAFLTPLPNQVNPLTGRIHASFNQTRARTTRLSASEPNLQQISARTKLGQELRGLFQGQDGNHLLVSDLSQIEVRITAHLTRDPFLMAIYQEERDLYRELAARFYQVDLDSVSKSQRFSSKTNTLATLFHASGFKISRSSLEPLADPPFYISEEDADTFVAFIHQTIPGIARLWQECNTFALRHGYAQTELGYRRWIKGLDHYDWSKKSEAERQAGNTPVQGLAAAVMKLILIGLEDASLLPYLVNTVHDEIIAEATRAELEDMLPVVVQIMQNAYPLAVPVIAEAGIGRSWSEAKD